MIKYIIAFFLILFSFSLSAQLIEDFTDGNFTSNPVWQGDTDVYIVNSNLRLQNMDSGSGSSYLSVPATTADSTTWEFYFRLDFAPSTSNQMRAYLNASQSDLTGPQDAYFLQVGASGSDDAIEFHRQDGVGSTLLLSSPPGTAATDPEIRVRVTRNQNQEWELLADFTGGTNFQSFGTITDGTHPLGQFFGFSNKFTSTRVDQFFFDDILISPLFTDMTPPVLISANSIDNTTIALQFNEPLNATSAEITSNYSLVPNVNILSATLDPSDPSRVLLTTEPLTNGTNYSITATGILDLENNIAGDQVQNFLFVQTIAAEPNDILINEIMADPAPQVGLPLFEFVELYNRSSNFINLEEFTISDANSTADPLPDFVLEPDSYVIICDIDNINAFSGFGPTLGVDNLPAFNNSEDRISLHDNEDNLIHTILYLDDFYRDPVKMQGGFTLELINPNLFCIGEDNWIGSNDPDGGTPGRVNSVFENTPDISPPSVVSATAINQTTLSILFSEVMSQSEVENPNNYLLTPGNFSPTSVILDEAGISATATFADDFIDQQEFNLTVTSVSDCVGNSIGSDNIASFTFFVTAPAERYDIIINEIFAAPTPSQGLPELEFVELYNRSDKAINLDNYTFDEGSSSGNTLPFFVLLPDAYVILQKSDAEDFSLFGDVIELDNFALTNGGELLNLLDPQGNTIDALRYDDDWYFDGREEGFSLERINPNNICTNEAIDWSSSFADIGGTPGAINNIVDQTNTDSGGPELTKVYMDRTTPNQVVLSFDRSLAPMSAANIENYSLNPSDRSVVSANLIAPLFNEVNILLNSDAEPQIIYTLETDIVSCNNNASDFGQTGRFAISEEIEPNDLILNEILHNPPEPEDILARYEVENPNALVMTDVPSYDDDEDQVVLLTLESVVVDELAYTSDFHNALLDDRNGVSLERTNPDVITQNIGNWASAAETVGFATPTSQNSQFTERTNTGNENQFISLVESTLSPDGDGFQDALIIDYQTTDPGFLVNVRIFDARGRLIRQLLQQTLIAAEGSLKWDGSTDDGLKAPIGIYILVAEFVNPDGRVQTDKETIVVAGRLE